MDNIRLITQPFTRLELKKVAGERFGDMVKAVVDIEQCRMAIGGELHADEEGFLLQNGSKQQNLWGINLYPDIEGDDFVEFDSMINIRPNQGNRSRGVEDEAIRQKIREIVARLISI